MNLGPTVRARMSVVFAGVLCLGWPLRLAGQQAPEPLTLPQAVGIALERNPERKAALADASTASADARQARSALLPRVVFSETATLGDDPVYVFGSKLRQGRFAAPDFGLNVLNAPGPFGNFSTRFGSSWNVFDSFASRRALARAERMEDAAGHQVERTDQEVVFRVIESYYGVLLGKRNVQASEQAVQTAQSILDRGRNRFESGVAVESDYLSAQVRLAARTQELIRAQNNLAVAGAQLSMAMGLSTGGEFNPVEALEERDLPVIALEEAENRAVQTRPDLKRVDSEVAAQAGSVAIARSAFGPRVNAFAGWQTDNRTLLSGGGSHNWLAGMEVQMDLFQGGAKRAQLAKERALQEKAAALKEMATDAVRMEVRRAYYDLDVARRQIEVARSAIADSKEALRIQQDRYESGLTTIADMMIAEEAVRRTETDYWEAVYRFHTNYARLELARGTLNSNSPSVTP